MLLTKEAPFFWEGYSRLWDWLKQANHHFIISLFNSPRPHSSGTSVHGISQARILESVAISSFRGSSQPKDWTPVFCVYWQLDSLPLSHLLTHKKEWNNAIHSNKDGTGDEHIRWSKSDRERQILFHITYMWNLQYDTKKLIYKIQ